MKTLRNLFLNELADIYDAEKRLVRALPTLAKVAAGADLKRILRTYAKNCAGHVARLEKIFPLFGVEVRSRPCEATIGLLKEADEIVSEFTGSPAIDAAVISAAQKIGHYKIVSYGCLREWSEDLAIKPATAILWELLTQEKDADETLTRVARKRSNEQALGEAAPTHARAKADGARTAAR